MQGNDDQYDSNIVIEELQKGYMLKDRVIRPAMVKGKSIATEFRLQFGRFNI